MADFKVIMGGKKDSNIPETIFIDASITDTRLMGVVGLRVHWIEVFDDEPDTPIDVYQFYYYDIEELGLDSVSVFELSDEEGVRFATKACFGGLGAKMIRLTERETLYLIDYFIKSTLEKKQELPPACELISKTIENRVPVLYEEEIFLLNKKMCVKTGKYGTVHYYLMRGFGKDAEGVNLLRSQLCEKECFEDLSLPQHATFLKNTIEEFYNDDGTISFLSESLVESRGTHYIVISELVTENNLVISAKKKNCFPISIEEASMLLVRREFCTVYAICTEMEEFDIDFAPFTLGTTKTEHETGDMYMDFKPDNNHAEERVFRLYDDIQTLYFVSDYGELIVAAYSEADISAAEKRIRKSDIKQDTKIMVKMELARSVLFDFVQSGYTHFGAYIKSLE